MQILEKYFPSKHQIYLKLSIIYSFEHGFGVYYDQQSREEGKDQESIQSSTTPDPEYHLGRVSDYFSRLVGQSDPWSKKWWVIDLFSVIMGPSISH